MRALTFLFLLWTSVAGAHEVHHAIAATNAATVSLSYADGSAFAYEKYELYADGKDVPVQVGNTDAAGRVVFVPGDTKSWWLKAWSADGHGVDLRFKSPTMQATATVPGDAGPGRVTLALFGLGVILTGFGLYQLFVNRRRKP